MVVEPTALTHARPPGSVPRVELISIRQGEGTAVINGRPQPYQAGHLFLLGPADAYVFAGTAPSRFGVLRFAPAGQPGAPAGPELLDLAQRTAQTAHGRLELAAPDRARLDALLVLLATPLPGALADALLRAVLDVLGCQPAAYGAACVPRVLSYIRQHITEPGRLRLERLAEEFAYSPQHLNALFKRATGESLHRYIVRYKLQLVEARLLRSTHTVSQIADELAFTDVSHLNKLFKKHYRATPSGYRRHRAPLTPTLL
jgi:AraC-like DNA-binding protein